MSEAARKPINSNGKDPGKREMSSAEKWEALVREIIQHHFAKNPPNLTSSRASSWGLAMRSRPLRVTSLVFYFTSRGASSLFHMLELGATPSDFDGCISFRKGALPQLELACPAVSEPCQSKARLCPSRIPTNSRMKSIAVHVCDGLLSMKSVWKVDFGGQRPDIHAYLRLGTRLEVCVIGLDRGNLPRLSCRVLASRLCVHQGLDSNSKDDGRKRTSYQCISMKEAGSVRHGEGLAPGDVFFCLRLSAYALKFHLNFKTRTLVSPS
ncbi:hypothetical protein C8R44DRAFT_849551 [Mycena epipterygia]|nr:hypothetical protein C8R44DRAFT_849551 [Mycena epipterygia]